MFSRLLKSGKRHEKERKQLKKKKGGRSGSLPESYFCATHASFLQNLAFSSMVPRRTRLFLSFYPIFQPVFQPLPRFFLCFLHASLARRVRLSDAFSFFSRMLRFCRLCGTKSRVHFSLSSVLSDCSSVVYDFLPCFVCMHVFLLFCLVQFPLLPPVLCHFPLSDSDPFRFLDFREPKNKTLLFLLPFSSFFCVCSAASRLFLYC